jgi:hypothetical protein
MVQQVADLVRVFLAILALSWSVLAYVVMVQQVPDLVRVFFDYFSTVLKCVRLCGGAAASGWLGSSFFGYLSWSVLACVVMVQQVPNLVRVFWLFWHCSEVCKVVWWCCSKWLTWFEFFLAILALSWSVLACVVMVQQVADLVRVFWLFWHCSEVCKVVWWCYSKWLIWFEFFFDYVALSWSVLACVVMVQQVANLVRVFWLFWHCSEVCKVVWWCCNKWLIWFEFFLTMWHCPEVC